ncbi:lipopolysaccharide heptosyltransferase I [bacterium endosymbiont of Pedicinus badii]|uniref:lipopolysaccharide heptosyltransferase I n=1 Tax=bacterium endosymbiont of Pedicinus badii TaxID=1719126 RepID=UPI0009BB1883|nr:lipopolysaccharide heptosyltransferase I [bacterium endosymbiont of Pedicinus badii]OQM34058.1 hypothetical protein AOQ89_01725 [bacterium endosymbiont of Pedicinus badii]
MKVLIVKTSSMGDILHTFPAISDAKNRIDISFDWIVEKEFISLVKMNSYIDNIIPISLRNWKRVFCNFREMIKSFHSIRNLKNTKYDLVIDAQGLLKSAIIAKFAYGRKIIGFDNNIIKEKMASFFYDKKYYTSEKHIIKKIKDLFSYGIGYKSRKKIEYNLQIKRKEKMELFFLYATSRINKKCSEDFWISLIKLANKKKFIVNLPCYEKKDYYFAKRCLKNNLLVKILYRKSIQEICQKMASSKGVVSVDTGLGHLASAIDCNNIMLYGPTDPNTVNTCVKKNQKYLVAKNRDMNNFCAEYVWKNFEKILYFKY